MAEVSGVTPAIAQETDGTRARILAEAVTMFTRHGYHRTSLRALADRLGITKAAILYHFPAKESIIAALMEPFIDALEAAVERAARVAPGKRQTVLLEGLLETYLDHRTILRMARTDATVFTQEPIYQRIVRLPRRTVEVMIGPDATLGERVWAVQLLSTLGDSVMLFDDEPVDELRVAILAGTARMLAGGPPYPGDGTGPRWPAARPHRLAARSATAAARSPATARSPKTPAAPAAPATRAGVVPGDDAAPAVPAGGNGHPAGGSRRVGRPRALSAPRIARAREMYRTGSHNVDEIAAALGVSRATVYRYLADHPSRN
jgi:AcrR family transcriptional regulator